MPLLPALLRAGEYNCAVVRLSPTVGRIKLDRMCNKEGKTASTSGGEVEDAKREQYRLNIG